MSFIQKLNTITGRNFRLPTEAEWEYAARGGNKSSGYLYSGSDNLDSVGWYADNSQHALCEVATKAPNELGLYDMSGSVTEWCSDYYKSYVAEPQLDPTGPEDSSLGRHVARGGAFNSAYYNCYVRTHSHAQTSQAGYYLGFRLALSKGD